MLELEFPRAWNILFLKKLHKSFECATQFLFRVIDRVIEFLRRSIRKLPRGKIDLGFVSRWRCSLAMDLERGTQCHFTDNWGIVGELGVGGGIIKNEEVVLIGVVFGHNLKCSLELLADIIITEVTITLHTGMEDNPGCAGEAGQ